MSDDDSSDLRTPRRKNPRSGRSPSRRPRSFVAQVMKAVTKAKGAGIAPASTRSGRCRSATRWRRRSRPRKGRCCRIGRGQAAADRLKLSAERRGPGERMRRVVVKARIVRLKLGSKGADAHLRYLQRDGTTGKENGVGSMGQRPTRRMAASLWSAGERTGISFASSSRPRTATGCPIFAPSPAT